MTHAFPAAIAVGDADALIDTLAPDVVLYYAEKLRIGKVREMSRAWPAGGGVARWPRCCA